jgi:amino acid transporter
MVPSDRPLYVKIKDIDLYTGMRENQLSISGANVSEEQRRASVAEIIGEKKKTGPMGWVVRVVRNVI